MSTGRVASDVIDLEVIQQQNKANIIHQFFCLLPSPLGLFKVVVRKIKEG